MKPRETSTPRGQDGVAVLRSFMRRLEAERARRVWPEIADPPPDQRAGMPHEIDCRGLTAHDLEQAFADELQRRKRWCREHCKGVYVVEPVRDERSGPDTGRRFCFSDRTDAAMFRLTFC